MNRVLRIALIAASTVAPSFAARAAGHSHVPPNSVWTLNLKESDFGQGMPMKSDVVTVVTDTDKWLKYNDVMVDGDGKTWKTSWSGPQDGTPKPLTRMPGAKASYKTADDSGHMEMPDGTTSDSVLSVSDDKKKVTFKVTGKMKDGKTFQQTLVYDRTS